jgi:hypothetical protein
VASLAQLTSVAGGRCDAAAQGEFIYAKYALFCMRLLKDNWTAAELEAQMPEGLGGAYALIMWQLTTALRKERPELLQLLTDKVLPVLVAAREPLSPALVAWACGHPEWQGDDDSGSSAARCGIRAQVKELLEVGLANLFPTRPAPGGGFVVQPYHKSVLDWFKGEEGLDAAEFRVEPRRGHELLGTVGEAYCHAELEPRPDGPVATERCNGYALRQTLAHLSKSHSDSAPAPAGGGLAVSALLDRLTLNFGFWQVSWRVWPCL